MNIKIIFAVLLCTSILSSCKKTTDELFREANTLSNNKEYDKAIKIYSELIMRNNKLELCYYNRGYCFLCKKEYGRALLDYNRIIDLRTSGGGQFIFTLNSDSPFASEEARYQAPYNDVIYQRGQVYFFLGKYKESAGQFNSLIVQNYAERKSNCYLWLGSIMLNSGDTTKACAYFSNSAKTAYNADDSLEATKMITAYCAK